MERKAFLQKFAIGGSLLLTSPVLFNACSSDDDDMTPNNDNNNNNNNLTIDLANPSFGALNAVGGFLYSGDIIIIHSSENNFIALSKICTHEGCFVGYNHSSGQLPCPCHGSVFSTTGSVLNGPAPTSLKKYNVKKEGNTLIIS